MAVYLLQALAVVSLVGLSYQQSELPSLMAIGDATELCFNATNKAGIRGSLDKTNPCKLKCLTDESNYAQSVDKPDGDECSVAEENKLPNICVKGKCTPQIPSEKPTDKGHPCTCHGKYLATEKSDSLNCVLTCVPDRKEDNPNDKTFETPALYGAKCSLYNKAGKCEPNTAKAMTCKVA